MKQKVKEQAEEERLRNIREATHIKSPPKNHKNSKPMKQ